MISFARICFLTSVFATTGGEACCGEVCCGEVCCIASFYSSASSCVKFFCGDFWRGNSCCGAIRSGEPYCVDSFRDDFSRENCRCVDSYSVETSRRNFFREETFCKDPFRDDSCCVDSCRNNLVRRDTFGSNAAENGKPVPIPATEVRAVWLATRHGLDWPKRGNSVAKQQRELLALLDFLQQRRFNTVLFQVRTRGEVFYRSQIEPMAAQVASSASFDPLAFVVEACHRRGMECHAWLVTYPLGSEQQVKEAGSRPVPKRHPSLVKLFKKEWYMDPGNPQTDDYLLALVEEVVAGYEVDGIHLDYVRYPDNSDRFPDDAMYRLYGRGKSRAQWRRDNVTRLVRKVYDRVKEMKPWVQVSSAPLGRYRELNGKGRGWTALETVYQDAGAWMQQGIQDMLFPMLYFKDELFYPFADDWLRFANGRPVVPGLGVYQMVELKWSLVDVTRQMEYVRRKGFPGVAYFRVEHLWNNTKGIGDVLDVYYPYPAKLPPMTWLSDTIPLAPSDLRAERLPDGKLELQWSLPSPMKRVTYNLYRSETEELSCDRAENILATGLREPSFLYPAVNDEKAYYYYVTVSDAYHNESAPCVPAFFYHSDMEK